MRILHVIPSISDRSGGPGQAILPMCRALSNAGFDVLLATTDADLDDATQLQSVTTYKGLPLIFFPNQFGAAFKYSHPFGRWLASNVANFDVVHIHAVFNHSGVAAARACRKCAVPYVVRTLGTITPWAMSQKSLRKTLSLRVGIARMLREASAIHYTSRVEQKASEGLLRLERGIVIPLGVEIPVIDRLLRWHPTREACPYLLVLARLLPTKGLDVLLEAFLSLVTRQEFKEWRLVLAGDGPAKYIAKLKRIAADQLKSDFVVFTGWLNGERKAAALRNASLLVLPSHHENFGLCVMESLACGVPVLISPNVNVAGEIEATRSGWVSSVDSVSLERTLAAALSSESELQARGRNGKLLAQNYSWSRIAEQLSALYTDIVSDKGQRLQGSEKLRTAAAGR